MSYQVLARKYRPHNFESLLGQEHVLRALINALKQKRLHHAYLFTGSRGVGKTTIARILAKCLNCEQGITPDPCEQCNSCQEINQGRFVDLIEVDAASRTKVEDTRDLLDNVQYAPTRGQYKVYLIDEVHMLSNHSFNALLKTLEEPPPHVIFLLATTDPQRLPVTVLSRCLQFNLKNLSAEKIKSHLAEVLTKEKIDFEASALVLLAKAANGSVRDALSLLDQAVAFSGGKVNTTEVQTMLGTIEQTRIFQLLENLAANNGKNIVALIDVLAEKGADFYSVLEDFLTVLHQIALVQVVADLQHSQIDDSQQIELLAKQFTPENIQLFYQIALIGRRDLPLAPSPRTGFEMILLRMLAFTPNQKSGGEKPSSSFVKNIPAEKKPAVIEATRTAAPIEQQSGDLNWPDLVPRLNLIGFPLALAQNCQVKEFADDQLHLLLDPIQAALKNVKQETRLKEALTSYFGKPINLQISVGSANLSTPNKQQQAKQSAQLQAAMQAVQEDPNIQTIVELFDAKIETGSIQIKDSSVVEK